MFLKKTSLKVHLAIQRPPYCHRVRLPNGPRLKETPMAFHSRFKHSFFGLFYLLTRLYEGSK